MKAKIIKFSDITKHPIKEKDTCGDCNRLYVTKVMISKRTNSKCKTHNWFCIKCYNKRFQ